MNKEVINNNLNMLEVLKDSKDFICAVFSLEGQLLYANAAFSNILLYEDNDLLQLNINKIFELKISEVLKTIDGQKTLNINIINKHQEFIQTVTTIVHSDDKILTLSHLLNNVGEGISSSEKLLKTLEYTKVSLLKQSDIEDNIFDFVLQSVKEVVHYNKAFVLLLEGDTLIVKESVGCEISLNYKKELCESDRNIAKIIKNQQSIIENSHFHILKELNLNIDKPASLIISPLCIRKMVYGLIILISDEAKYKKDDKTILEALSAVSSYLIKDAELTHVFKMQLNVLKDNIKERTKTLELIKEQNKKILEADRVKNEFLANMSHELRTPLNAIIGFSEALSLRIFGDLNEKQQEYVGDIHASGIHLLGMINDLLDLSKIESGKMELNKELFDAVLAVNEAVNIVSPLAEKKDIDLSIENKAGLVELKADRRKFQQILYNLLSNAIKFTENKGNVLVIIERNKKNILITVKDNGIGIPKNHQDKVFTKFHQVDSSLCRKHGSTGLGLTITKELVDMHGGKISLVSTEGKGTEFLVELPLNQ